MIYDDKWSEVNSPIFVAQFPLNCLALDILLAVTIKPSSVPELHRIIKNKYSVNWELERGVEMRCLAPKKQRPFFGKLRYSHRNRQGIGTPQDLGKKKTAPKNPDPSLMF